MENQNATGLLDWQWAGYGLAHRDRRNLLLHALTTPLFLAGSAVALVGGFLLPWWSILAGLAAASLAIGLQGRGHRREVNPPAPFRGPVDVVIRLLAEQWITFPRYVLSGEFARAWRGEPR
jgi:hypothetical protein